MTKVKSLLRKVSKELAFLAILAFAWAFSPAYGGTMYEWTPADGGTVYWDDEANWVASDMDFTDWRLGNNGQEVAFRNFTITNDANPVLVYYGTHVFTAEDASYGLSKPYAALNIVSPWWYTGETILAITSGTYEFASVNINMDATYGGPATLVLHDCTLKTSAVTGNGTLYINGGTFDTGGEGAYIYAALGGYGILTKTGAGELVIAGDMGGFFGTIFAAEGSVRIDDGDGDATNDIVIESGEQRRFGDYVWTGAAGDGLWATLENWQVNGYVATAPPTADSIVAIPEGDGKELVIRMASDSYTGNLTINRDVELIGNNVYVGLGTVDGTGMLTLSGYSNSRPIRLRNGGSWQIRTNLRIKNWVYLANTLGDELVVYGALYGDGRLSCIASRDSGVVFYGDTSNFTGSYSGGLRNNGNRDRTRFLGDARGSATGEWTFGSADDYNRCALRTGNTTYYFGSLNTIFGGYGRFNFFVDSKTTLENVTMVIGGRENRVSDFGGTLSRNSNKIVKVGATSTLNITLNDSYGQVEAREGTTILKGTAPPYTLNITGTGAIIKIARYGATADDPETEEDESGTTSYIPTSFAPGFGGDLVGGQYEVTQEMVDGVIYDVYTVVMVARDCANNEYGTVAEAIAALADAEDKTITLAADTTEAVALPLGYTLVMNGFTAASVTGAGATSVIYDEETQTYTTVDNSEAVWVGGDEGLWSDPSNWSSRLVPSDGTVVVFNNTATVFLEGNETYNCGVIYIERFHTVTFAPVDFDESHWPRIRVSGNTGDGDDIASNGGCVLKLYRCGIENGKGESIRVRPTIEFYNTIGDSWMTGDFSLRASLQGTGEFRVYNGKLNFESGSGIFVNAGSVVNFMSAYPTFAGSGGTLTSTGANGDGRIIVNTLPPSGIIYFQNAFKNAERWAGTLELNGMAMTNIDAANYGNTNSTVCFNGVSGYMRFNDGMTNEVGAVKAIEIGENGLSLNNGFTNGSFGYTIAADIIGSGPIHFGTRHNQYVGRYYLTGDLSGFTGAIDFYSSEQHSYPPAVIIKDADEADPEVVGNAQIIVSSSRSVTISDTWDAPGGIVVYGDATIASGGALADGTTLSGSGRVTYESRPETLPVLSESWTGTLIYPMDASGKIADTPYNDGIGANSNGCYRIPAMAAATNGVLLALFDLRYNSSGDLPNAIDAAECWSGDMGNSWSTPRVGIDVDNSNHYSKQCDFGDPCILYDPAADQFWAMGITGGGLAASHSGGSSIADVVLYTRGSGSNDAWQEWTGGPADNERSVKQMILDSLYAIDPKNATNDEDAIRGILQGPGHGIVQTKTVYASDGETVLMPAGALIFPMQYFPSKSDYNAYAFAVYSTDGGATWRSTKLVPSGEYSQENCVMELDDGSWYMICKGKTQSDKRRQLFRSTDYVNWTYSGSITPSEWVQGSCLRIGQGADGTGRYVACFSPSGRSDITLHFGRDTTAAEPNGNGVVLDLGKRVIYPGSTGGMGYNSLAMLDENTLGILLEADGNIYFRTDDISDILALNEAPPPEPAAVWEGDFGADSLSGAFATNGYSIVDWNLSHADDWSSVTIDLANQGLMFDATNGMSGITVIVKYSGLEPDANGRTNVLFTSSVTASHYFDRTGVVLRPDGTLVGIWNSSTTSTGNTTYGTASGSVPASGVMAFTYAGGDGTYLYCGDDIKSLSSVWGDYRLKSSRDVIYGAGIGGMYRGSTWEGAQAAQGMTISAVAVFDHVLTLDEMQAYKWPSSSSSGFNPATDTIAEECVLRISEIMPKPTDAQNPGRLEGMDVNGLESGWVELENTSDQWADLADYRFMRTNRGKKTGQAEYGNFPSRLIPPHSRTVFYTSERYSNSNDKDVSAFADGTFDGKPIILGNTYYNILVWGGKVNPKKSPFVRLYYAPGGDDDAGAIVDTVVVPSDLPEGWSIIVGDTVEGEATARWMCPTPTRGKENSSTDALTRIGPNAGPLYELGSKKKHNSANEFARQVPPAVPGEDYEITFSFNPVMHPTQVGTFRDEDAIASISLVYRTDLDDDTLAMVPVDLLTGSNDTSDWGWTYTATIPASALPAAGHLIQWKFIATDASGNDWTSPSFNNPDDGYEWYGTIVEPTADQLSVSLPTWHMFATPESLAQMDIDASDQTLPNNARVAIYDSSTSNYYDYVRIDLRGNTSARFTKKGHGLRFAKAHPLTMTDVVTGEEIEEIRKTSLISEFADPSYMRQMVAFWLWRKMGNLVPFDFPVRCNLNGEFYQLAFNSERFTDELIEDVYGLDKFGYGYKNVGTLNSTTTTAGGIEKKTPDDEKENDISVLVTSLVQPLRNRGAYQTHATENAELTKFVVENFDLPAWLNYLASARITQEMDDVWANVCAYYDNAEMKEGERGTGTWMPLGYDFNLSFGQYYYNDVSSGALSGLSATEDWFKSHPLYGGWTIPAHKSANGSAMNGNNGFEAVYQSAKFRRLYLRRLRTLMDAELKAPGTSEENTPFMVEMRRLADLMRADAALDKARWPNDSTDDAIDVWRNGATRPADLDAGIDEIWNNYVVPRRTHLFATHSVTNSGWEIGYGADLNAGIPEAQSPIETLARNISISNARYVASEGVCVITNGNAEAVDMSGWTLTGAVKWTLPSGTVCDAFDVIYVVADRRAYIATNKAALTDQVIVGNAKFSTDTTIALSTADGTQVFESTPVRSINVNFTDGNSLDPNDNTTLVGAYRYAVPCAAWDNVVGENSTASAHVYSENADASTDEAAVTLQISGTRGYWTCSNLTAESDIMYGYIDDHSDYLTPTVTLSGIPFENCRVVIYASTDSYYVPFGYFTVNGIDLTSNNDSIASEGDFRTTYGTTNWGNSGPSYSALALAEGVNYLVSPVISLDGEGALTIVAHRPDSSESTRGTIAAIQIIETSEVPPMHTVTFDLDGKGERIGGGELVQSVAEANAAKSPIVAGVDGWYFSGWDADFSVVTNDVTITALYEDNLVQDDYSGIVVGDSVNFDTVRWLATISYPDESGTFSTLALAVATNSVITITNRLEIGRLTLMGDSDLTLRMEGDGAFYPKALDLTGYSGKLKFVVADGARLDYYLGSGSSYNGDYLPFQTCEFEILEGGRIGFTHSNTCQAARYIDMSRITGEGALSFDTPYSGNASWTMMPTNIFADTLSFNNEADVIIPPSFSNATPLCVRNLSGEGRFRCDWNDNANFVMRRMRTVQTRNTTFTGRFMSNSNGNGQRECNLDVLSDGEAPDYENKRLTLSGTGDIVGSGSSSFGDAKGTLTVEKNGALEINYMWGGPAEIHGAVGGSGGFASNLVFHAGCEFICSTNTSLTATGTITFPEHMIIRMDSEPDSQVVLKIENATATPDLSNTTFEVYVNGVLNEDYHLFAVSDRIYLTHLRALAEVTFDLGEHGTYTGDGELQPQILQPGEDAVVPEFAVEWGWRFVGWSSPVTDIQETGPITISAIYDYDFALEFDTVAMDGCEFNATIVSHSDLGDISFAVGGLPGWLTLNPDGTLSGTPLFTGECEFTVVITGEGGSVAVPFIINVAENPNHRPQIAAVTPLDGKILEHAGDTFTFEVEANDVDGDTLRFIWSLDGSSEYIYTDEPRFTTTLDPADLSQHFLMCAVDDGFWQIPLNGAWRFRNAYDVTFDLAASYGERTGGGELSQLIEATMPATAPSVVSTDERFAFAGWSDDFSRITSDMVVTALYSRVNRPIIDLPAVSDGVGTALVNHDVTIDWSVRDLNEELTGDWRIEWSDSEGNSGIFADLEGTWTTRWTSPGSKTVTLRVTDPAGVTDERVWAYEIDPASCAFVEFEIGSLGRSIGGGAVSQWVNLGEAAIAPTVMAVGGWLFTGWDSDFSAVESNMVVTAQYMVNQPDLTVINLTTDALTFQGGNNVNVSWTVANTGNASFQGRMTEFVRFISPDGTITNNMATLAFDGAIAREGGSIYRTASLSLPLKGMEGEWFVEVETGAAPSVMELAGNNTARMACTIAIETPPLPDIEVFDVTYQVTEGIGEGATLYPGDVVEVSYMETNSGGAPVADAWLDRISIVDANGVRVALTTLERTADTLVVTDEPVTQVVEIVVPDYISLAGTVKFLVEADIGDSIVEANDANNSAVSADAELLIRMYMTAAASSVAENNTSGVRFTLRRSGPVADAMEDFLFATPDGQVTLPESVTIPAGSASTTFYVTPIDNDIVDGPRTVEISESAVATIATVVASAPFPLTIIDNEVPHLYITLDNDTLREGDGVITATVTRELVTNEPLTVYLSGASRCSYPSSVVIPAGEESVTFEIAVPDNAIAQIDQEVTIRASSSGFTSASVNYTVEDDDVPSVSLSLTPYVVSEGAGANAIYAILMRSDTNQIAQAVTVNLQQSPADQLDMRSQIVIPKYTMGVRFPIGVIDNAAHEDDREVTITGSIFIESCGCSGQPSNGDAIEATVLIIDNDESSLALKAEPTTMKEGFNPAGYLVLSHNSILTEDLTVRLSVDEGNENEIDIPTTVTIRAGETSVRIPVETLDDGVEDGGQLVSVYAEDVNNVFAPASTWIQVSDQNLPDLAVAGIDSPATVIAMENFDVSFAATNVGFMATSRAIPYTVHLTRGASSSALSASTLVKSGILTGGLEPGGSALIASMTLAAPEMPGDYRVAVVLDPDGTISELDTANNTLWSETIGVSVAWTATAGVDGAKVYMPGESVVITGVASRADGTPAANVQLDPFVMLNGTRRSLLTTTAADGSYSVTFTPSSGEAGDYGVGACYPGVNSRVAQDTFSIIGMRRTSSSNIIWDIGLGDTETRTVTIQNRSAVPLTGLAATFTGVPDECDFSYTLPDEIPANGSVTLSMTATAINLTDQVDYRQFHVHIEVTEGLSLDFPLYFHSQAQRAYLRATPCNIDTTMAIDHTRYIEVTVVNDGKGDSGVVTVSIPDVSWLKILGGASIDNLASGESATITLALSPTTEDGLTLNSPLAGGMMTFRCANGTGDTVFLKFTPVSEQTGSVAVDVVDNNTYYLETAPHLANATVRISNPYTGVTVATGTTGEDGVWEASNIPEGRYQLTITAPNHDSFADELIIEPGKTTSVNAFVQYKMVSVDWTVEKTQIDDSYEIKVLLDFETQVPAPIVRTTFPREIPKLAEGESYAFPVLVVNDGVIAAEEVWITMPTITGHTFTLSDNGMTIPAKSSIELACVLTRARSGGDGETGGPGGSGGSGDTIGTGGGSQSTMPNVCWHLAYVDTYWHCGIGYPRYRYEVSIKYGDCPQSGGNYYPTVETSTIPDYTPSAQSSNGIPSRSNTQPSSGSFPGGFTSSLGSTYSKSDCNPESSDVCASVTLKLSQTLSMTREAFDGTLTLYNGHSTTPITDLKMDVSVLDEEGNERKDLFEIFANGTSGDMSEGSVMAGGLSVSAGGTGSAMIRFIPERGAAPTEEKLYRFGGTVTYTDPFTGETATVKLTPVSLTVVPSPYLHLDYFVQRDVFADDPFTADVIEASMPAEMAVLVRNVGGGNANSVTIASAKPEKVRNDKGLLVDFDLKDYSLDSTALNGATAHLGLNTVTLGTIEPNESKVAQWWLTSTIEGHFVGMSATVTPVNSWNTPDTMLVDPNVGTHMLVRSIVADGDALPDFLTSNGSDFYGTPNEIYTALGDQLPVHVAAVAPGAGLAAGRELALPVTLSPARAGWNYGCATIPGIFNYTISRIVRGDGTEISERNAWITDRTFRDGETPLIEDRLHIVDYFASSEAQEYTVFLVAKPTDKPAVVAFEGLADGAIEYDVRDVVTVTFTKPINPATFTTDDLRLIRQGDYVNDLSALVITPADETGMRFTIGNLSSICGEYGRYELDVQCAGIEDMFGTLGEHGRSISWVYTTAASPYIINADGIPVRRVQRLDEVEVTLSAPIIEDSFTREALQLNGKALSSAVSIRALGTTGTRFAIANLADSQTEDGEYKLTIDATRLVSIDGTTHGDEEFETATWMRDTVAPQLLAMRRDTEGDGFGGARIIVEFSEDVEIDSIQRDAFKLEKTSASVRGKRLLGASSISLPSNIGLVALGGGRYALTGVDALLDGDGQYRLTYNAAGVIDEAENENAGDELTISWVRDTTAPDQIEDLAISPDGGHSDSDGITYTRTLTVTGTLPEDDLTVEIFATYVGGGETRLALFDGNDAGAFSRDITLTGDGSVTLSVRLTDAAGNSSISSKAVFIDCIALTAEMARFVGDEAVSANEDGVEEVVTDTVVLSFSDLVMAEDVTLGNFSLALDGQAIALDGVALELLESNGAGRCREARLTNLAALCEADGRYALVFAGENVRKYSSGLKMGGDVVATWIYENPDREPPVVTAVLFGGEEPRDAYTNVFDSVSVTFNESVNFPDLIANGLASLAARIDLLDADGVVTGTVAVASAPAWDEETLTLSWTLNPDDVPAGNARLFLDGALITDLAGNHLSADGFDAAATTSGFVLADETLARVAAQAMPCWHDGKLFVGEKIGNIGKIREYSSDGSAWSYLQANGVDIEIAAQGCQGASVAFADLDGDGADETYVGTYDGKVLRYPDGVVVATLGANRAVLFSLGNLLFVGDIDGRIRIILNGPTGLMLSEPIADAAGLPLTVPNGRASPVLADINADGVADILSGDTKGNIWAFYATRNAWLGTPVCISTNDVGLADRSRLAFGDVEGDGIGDLIVGRSDGTVSLMNGAALPTPALPFSVKAVIAASAGEHGEVTPSGVTTYDGGDAPEYSIIPDNGYFVADVLVDGESVGACTNYVFAPLATSHTISASFAPITYNITYVDEHNAENYGNPTNYTIESEAITFVAPGDVYGWVFNGWTPAQIPAGSTGDVTATANWQRTKFDVTVDGQPTSYDYEEVVTFTAPVDPVFEDEAMQVFAIGTTYTAPVVTNEVTVSVTAPISFDWDILATNFWFAASETQNGSIVAPEDGWMAYGTNFTLTATAADHYHFVQWTGDVDGCEAHGSTLDVTMDCPRTIGVDFTIDTFAVTFVAGAHGALAGETAQTIGYGSGAIAPTVTPATGYAFTGWDVGFSEITDALTVTAQYEPITYTIEFVDEHNAENYGNPTNYTIESEAITFVAPGDVYGWVFNGWTPAGIPAGSMGDVTATASWQRAKFDVTVDGETTQYDYEDEVTFTAPVDPVFEDEAMQVFAIGTTYTDPVVTNEVTVSVTAPISFDWDILATNFWFEASETQNGSIVAPEDGWMAYGTNFTLTATAADHYHFVQWTGDVDGCEADGATLDVTMDCPRTIVADFAIDTFAVTFVAGAHGTLAGETAQTIGYGSGAIAPTVTPATGYAFTGWDVGFSEITDALTVTAQYEPITYTIEYVDEFGAENDDNPTNYTIESEAITFVASGAVYGWVFNGWTPAGIPAGSTGDVTVTANWQRAKFDVTVDGETVQYDYEATVTLVQDPAVVLNGAEKYVCTGWTATNAEPANGVGASAEFNVLGDVEFAWLWETNIVTLAEAVDAQALEWTTNGAVDWTPQWSEQASDGIDCAFVSGVTANANASLCVAVDGPGEIAFSWASALSMRTTKLQVVIDGVVAGVLTGTNDWTISTVSVVGTGSHEISWRVITGRGSANAADWAALDAVVWTAQELPPAGYVPTFEEALGTNLSWKAESDGNVKWSPVARTDLSETRDAWAVVERLGNDMSATLSARVFGPGVLTFDWAVSCEEEYDWLEIDVDGAFCDYITGDTPWTRCEVEIIGEGWHTVTWSFVKDELDDEELAGDNTARLDSVVWESTGEAAAPSETQTTPVPVPFDELEKDGFSEYLSQAEGDYEAAAKIIGANGYPLWQSYVAGLTPNDPESRFTASIEILPDGTPKITWTPDTPELRESRTYTTYGKASLSDEDWTPIVDEESKRSFNFFRVGIEMNH